MCPAFPLLRGFSHRRRRIDYKVGVKWSHMSIAMKKCFPSPASICDIGEKPGELIGDTEDGGIDYTLFDWFSAQWTHSHSLFISVLDFWVHYSPAVVSVMYRMLSSYPYPENQERIAPSSCVGEKASQFLFKPFIYGDRGPGSKSRQVFPLFPQLAKASYPI